MIGVVTSSVVTQEKLGQRLEKCMENTQRVDGGINDVETCIGVPSVGNTEKAGRKADSVQSRENR